MSKILLLGYNPPHFERQSKIEAAHYRTWQFLQPLLSEGHHVCLVVDRLGTEGNSSGTLEPVDHLVYQTFSFRQPGWPCKLQQIHDEFRPDCIVAVNFSSCLYATKLRTSAPIWMDIYGDMLTIMQAARYRAGSDRGIPTSIRFMHEVLRTGDIFSACGTPQAHMLVGELAMAGRLNSRTFGYDFTRVVLPGAAAVKSERLVQSTRALLSKHGVGEDDFVALWCGGYNTWTDVETLFAGLEAAMAQEPRIHYVSVGANTYEAPDNVYRRLLGMIEQSEFRTHFHMLGWRPWTEIADYYRESNVGVNIDALHYETIYGTRTRLVEMMGAGLPVITTLGSELSYLLQTHQAGLGFEIGDWRQLAKHIVDLARDNEQRENLIKSANRYAATELSFQATTAPIRQWVYEPRLAPDKRLGGVPQRRQQLEHEARAFTRQLLWQVAGLDK